MKKAMSLAEYDVKLLQVCGIDPQLRPENLTPEQFLHLFDTAEK